MAIAQIKYLSDIKSKYNFANVNCSCYFLPILLFAKCVYGIFANSINDVARHVASLAYSSVPLGQGAYSSVPLGQGSEALHSQAS